MDTLAAGIVYPLSLRTESQEEKLYLARGFKFLFDESNTRELQDFQKLFYLDRGGDE